MSREKECGLRAQAKSRGLFSYEDAVRLNRDVEHDLHLQLEDSGKFKCRMH